MRAHLEIAIAHLFSRKGLFHNRQQKYQISVICRLIPFSKGCIIFTPGD